ncbi:uncharacterized protein LOC128548891 [Mercenaria mercenaria]|uniref:uncharacterized protein LOC128548891 n=1 Tax=Mercenaria mercenaria TaxID=6596 RepID=UPI00234F50D6|nr:uncharacterized protein LOC128548891 [Mercenaria mercenaria]
MVTRNKMHHHLKYIPVFMCFFFSCLSVSVAVTTEEVYEKQKLCEAEVMKLETELEEAIGKLTNPTPEEIEEVTNNFHSTTPAACEFTDEEKKEMCNVIKLVREEKVQEVLSQQYTNPTEDQIKEVRENMEKQISAEECDSNNTLTVS